MRLWKSAASPLVFPVGLVRLGAVWSGYRPPQAALSGSGVEAGVPTSSIRAPLYLEVFRGPTPGYPYTPHRHRRCTWRSPMICKDAITRRSRSVAVRPFHTCTSERVSKPWLFGLCVVLVLIWGAITFLPAACAETGLTSRGNCRFCVSVAWPGVFTTAQCLQRCGDLPQSPRGAVNKLRGECSTVIDHEEFV